MLTIPPKALNLADLNAESLVATKKGDSVCNNMQVYETSLISICSNGIEIGAGP